MQYVNEVTWYWEAACPECATSYMQYESQVDESGVNPGVTCDNKEGGEVCGCVFTVTCIEN